MSDQLPPSWHELLAQETSTPYWSSLQDFVATERRVAEIYPPVEATFRAFELTAPHEVRVVILGQDPYHSQGQANGLCFSVNNGVKIPPSLRNIYKELQADCDIEPSSSGDLTTWARQGVLLLNTTLTVRHDGAGTHQGHGWEVFTDAVVHTSLSLLTQARCLPTMVSLAQNPFLKSIKRFKQTAQTPSTGRFLVIKLFALCSTSAKRLDLKYGNRPAL